MVLVCRVIRDLTGDLEIEDPPVYGFGFANCRVCIEVRYVLKPSCEPKP